MATVTRYPSIKRFGARYGRRVKYKVGKIEEERRLSTECPYCLKNKARRIAVGIWECTKCNNKFTGRAYVIGKTAKSAKEEEHMIEIGDLEEPEKDEELANAVPAPTSVKHIPKPDQGEEQI